MQSLIFDAYPDSRVAVCAINMDGPIDHLRSFGLVMPMLQHADAAFARMKLGWQYGTYAPLYLVIDKRGIIRWKSNGQGSISVEHVATMIDGLLEE